MSTIFLRDLLRWAALVAFGYFLGYVAEKLALPLPWLIAPLVGAAALSLAGLPVGLPTQMRKLGQMGVAVAIGTTFSVAVLLLLLKNLPLIVASGAMAIVVGSAIAIMLARRKGMDLATTFFLCMPGGVAEMSVMAERHGGDTGLVGLGQSLRIIVIVLTTPYAVLALNHWLPGSGAGEDIATAGAAGLHWPQLVLTFGGALALGWLFDRKRVMNAWFLAGLIAGLALVLGPWTPSVIPKLIPHLCQVLIGLALGARISRATVVKMRHFLPFCIGSTLLLMLVGFAMAPVLHAISGVDIPTLVLATSPGGVAEMSITASSLHLVAPLVTAYHLVRILLVVFLNDPLYRLARRFNPRTL